MRKSLHTLFAFQTESCTFASQLLPKIMATFSTREKNLLKRIELRNQRMRVAPQPKGVKESIAEANLNVIRSLEAKIAKVK